MTEYEYVKHTEEREQFLTLFSFNINEFLHIILCKESQLYLIGKKTHTLSTNLTFSKDKVTSILPLSPSLAFNSSFPLYIRMHVLSRRVSWLLRIGLKTLKCAYLCKSFAT